MASFSTDFDGVGSGEAIRVNFGANYGVNYGAYAFAPGHVAEADAAQIAYQQELQRRYEEQLEEAKARVLAEEQRREEEAERARELEEARAREQARLQAVKNVMTEYQSLKTLEGDKPAVVLTKALDIDGVIDLEKTFDQLERGRAAAQKTLFQQLAALLRSKKKAAPKRDFGSVLVWGLWSTPAEAAEATKKPTINPFNGKPFDQVFAFGTSLMSVGPSDLQRVVLDHFMSTIDLLSLQSSLEAAGLRGATVDELVCHSNGFRIVEALIANGDLTVKKLRILGGDGVLGEVDRLEQLAADKGLTEVSAYIVDGDPVPHSDVCWEIRQQMKEVGHGLQTFDSQKQNPVYQFMGLVDTPAFNPAARVQVHVLSPPPGVVSPVQKHLYPTYENLIYLWRGSGCMTQNGQINPRCIIH